MRNDIIQTPQRVTPQRKIVRDISCSGMSFFLAQLHFHIYFGFGDQLEMNAAGLRSLLYMPNMMIRLVRQLLIGQGSLCSRQ